MRFLLFITTLVVLSACKVKSGNAEAASTESESTYNYTVSFTSPGDGIDADAFRKVKAYVLEHKPAIEHIISPWGKEGERDICMNLNNLKKDEVESFKSSIKDMVSSSNKVNIYEDGSCRNRNR